MRQIYCSNCGKLVNIKSNFCKFCGAPQRGKEANFRVSDPQVAKHSPNVAAIVSKPVIQKSPSSNGYIITERHLGPDALMFFVMSYLYKSFLLFVMLLIGAILGPVWFILIMIFYVVGVVLTAYSVYSNFMYSIDKHGLYIRKGILYKHKISVPFVQIQNVNVERTIMDRILGVSRVKIETGGYGSTPSRESMSATNAQSEAYLPGLRFNQAKKVHDILIDGVDGIHGN